MVNDGRGKQLRAREQNIKRARKACELRPVLGQFGAGPRRMPFRYGTVGGAVAAADGQRWAHAAGRPSRPVAAKTAKLAVFLKNPLRWYVEKDSSAAK